MLKYYYTITRVGLRIRVSAEVLYYTTIRVGLRIRVSVEVLYYTTTRMGLNMLTEEIEMSVLWLPLCDV